MQGGQAAQDKGVGHRWSSKAAKDASLKGQEAKRNIKERLANIIARMNWIGEQGPEMREALREECRVSGHIPSGEQIMTNPPKNTCYHCGDEYR